MTALNNLLDACVRGGLSEIDARSLIEQVRNEPTQLVLVETSDTDPFAEFWRIYPKRYGTNSKKDAATAFRAAIKEGHKPRDMIEGAKAYGAMLARDNKIGTQYVLQAARFVRSREFDNQLSMIGVKNVQVADDRQDVANRRTAHASATMAGGFFRALEKR